MDSPFESVRTPDSQFLRSNCAAGLPTSSLTSAAEIACPKVQGGGEVTSHSAGPACQYNRVSKGTGQAASKFEKLSMKNLLGVWIREE
jgi:hypothetical protein